MRAAACDDEAHHHRTERTDRVDDVAEQSADAAVLGAVGAGQDDGVGADDQSDGATAGDRHQHRDGDELCLKVERSLHDADADRAAERAVHGHSARGDDQRGDHRADAHA